MPNNNQLADLDKQIEQRKRYLRDQEKLIADIIETGNSRMMELRHETLVAEQELRSIKTDIRTAKCDRKLLYEEMADMRLTISTALEQPILANAGG